MDFITFKNEVELETNQCEGRFGVMIEIEDEVIAINSQEVFQSASIIKVPILIEGFRQQDQGKLELDSRILLEEYQKCGGSGVLQALSAGANVTVKDLLTLMIIVSDNTATNISIDLLGMEQINACLKDMELTSTVLSRKMMDFKAIQEGRDNTTTAEDMVRCLKVINETSFLSIESRKSILAIMGKQQFMDKLPAMMDLAKLTVFNKTGGLTGVSHDCAIVTHGKMTAYAAVLTDGLTCETSGRDTIGKIGKLLADYMIEKEATVM